MQVQLEENIHYDWMLPQDGTKSVFVPLQGLFDKQDEDTTIGVLPPNVFGFVKLISKHTEACWDRRK